MRLLFLFLKIHHQGHFLCQKELLSSQYKALKQLKKLFSLNPMAKKLQRKREKAERDLTLALGTGDPLMISKAKIALLQIKTAQNLFHKKQKSHIQKVRTFMHSPETRLKNLFERKNKLSSYSFFSPEKPAISPHPPDSLSPIYRPDWNFEEKQILKVFWTFNLKNILGENIQSFLKNHPTFSFHLSGKCGATITRSNNGSQKWTSTLVKVSVF